MRAGHREFRLAFAVAALLVAWPASNEGAAAGKDAGRIEATVVGLELKVQLLDANPDFLFPKLAAKLYGAAYGDSTGAGLPSNLLEAIDRINPQKPLVERKGAVADGVSRILIYVRANAPGEVSVRIRNPSPVEAAEIRTEELTPLVTKTIQTRQSHGALYLYRPPESFGAAGGERTARFELELYGRTVRVEHRPVDLEIAWTGAGGQTHTEAKTLWLLRPPVVLVHGTYDNGQGCFDWRPGDPWYDMALAMRSRQPAYDGYATESLAKQLADKGLAAFVVNYRLSNGTDPTGVQDPRILAPPGRGGPDLYASYFRDNAKVVWYGGRLDHPEKDRGQGIQHALTAFRDTLKVAVTKADVVGHSMGGVLVRVFARGNPLLGTARARGGLPAPGVLPDREWHKRRNNWFAGDVNRLITIGATHKGSHIPQLLEHIRSLIPGWARDPAWDAVNKTFAKGKFSPGAFTDQAPGSLALREIGATPVPAFAIAAVATVRDLDWFEGVESDGQPEPTYRERMKVTWEAIPIAWHLDVLKKHTGRDADGQEIMSYHNVLAAVVRDHQDATRQLAAEECERCVARDRLNERIRGLEREATELKERQFLRWVAAVFHNDWTDYTSSLDSQLGGLEPGRGAAIVPGDYQTARGRSGVLHGYEPRHRLVQDKVIELLLGGLAPFKREGFPDLAKTSDGARPRNFAPGQARFEPHTLDCPEAPGMCPPR